MNSYYLFVTIHGHGVNIKDVSRALKKGLPYCSVSVSDKKFKNVR